jgi:hypothetical protein
LREPGPLAQNPKRSTEQDWRVKVMRHVRRLSIRPNRHKSTFGLIRSLAYQNSVMRPATCERPGRWHRER